MKQIVIIFISLLSIDLFSQSVGIGTSTPDTCAILDLSSTNKGFLLPRMSTSQRDLISTPSIGLKIFNTDDFCEDTYDGSKWAKNCAQLVIGDSILPADKWTEIDPIPNGVERYGMFSFAFGNKIITGLGRKEFSPNYPTDIWEYDVITKIWTQKNNFPGLGRHAMFNCVVLGKGYIVGGSNASIAEVWEYNPLIDTWIQKGNFPGGDREYLAGFTIGDKTYMGTGNGISPDYENDFWEYTPLTDTWVQKSDVPGSGRWLASGFAIGNKGYMGMGSGPTTSDYLSDWYEYSFEDDEWEIKDGYPGGGGRALTSFVIGNRAYVGLGVMDGNILPIMYKFNPNATPTNQWTALNDFPGIARITSFRSVINNKAYLGCGYVNSNTLFSDFWVYNPNPDTLNNYKQQVPEDVNNIINHDWTSEDDSKLYTSNTKYKVGIGTKTPKVKLHVEGNNDAGLGDNSGLLLVGNIDGGNIVIDNNEIMARDNALSSQLILQNNGGNTLIGGNTRIEGKLGIDADADVQLHIKNGGDVGYNTTTTGFLQLGPTDGSNIIMDNNEIMARNNSQTSDLILQNDGGRTLVGGDLEVDGLVKGAFKLEMYDITVTPAGSTQTITVGNKSFIRVLCGGGNCASCSGSSCADVILTDGEDAGQLLILYGLGNVNSNLYMPSSNSSTTNYSLTSNFQLTAGNMLTLIWVPIGSSDGVWKELSRAIY